MSDVAPRPIRSPSYPSMALREAVEAVKKIENQYRSSPVDRTVAAKLIGYSSLSGPANSALAALASYGLIERAGKGEARVTPRARAILYAENDREKVENLLAAASDPDLYRELRERFEGISVPPEDGVLSYLARQGFNPSAVKPAARSFLQTMAFVEELGANESHGDKSRRGTESTDPLPGGDDLAKRRGGAKVGDFIQWESQGALQFPKPLRVRLVSEDGEWIAVEGSETGIPMSEVTVQDAPADGAPKTPPTFKLPNSDSETAKPAAGEIEWMRNSLGQATNVRLLVKGDMGPREIGKLIRLLKAQKAVLEDDDEEGDGDT